jgi:hypothetical protein
MNPTRAMRGGGQLVALHLKNLNVSLGKIDPSLFLIKQARPVQDNQRHKQIESCKQKNWGFGIYGT